jgi:hypothetical protein
MREQGKALLFDDSFEHHVTHVGSFPRYALLLARALSFSRALSLFLSLSLSISLSLALFRSLSLEIPSCILTLNGRSILDTN